MLFNSIEYALFLPIVFLLYWFVFKSRKSQNLFIVLVSYLFYGWWDWRFLILLVFSTFISFICGVLINQQGKETLTSKYIVIGNIILNLSILGMFKYYNFFVDNFYQLFNAFGLQLDWVTIEIILPIGISFYTFQTLSYTIDVYRGKIKATNDIIAFFAFVSFFPQLVAGPIERATNLLPQFCNNRIFDYKNSVVGLRQILWGLFKKVVVADNGAIYVNKIFADYQSYDGLTLLIVAIYFAFQIYCDFSGYSDIAIGSARLFGISLMRNFAYPYFSKGIAEFWQRWHISLTSWFKDYIYIPLGGNKCSKLTMIRNVFIVFMVSGLWHGANWTFICWGIYNAILFFISMVTMKKIDIGVLESDNYLLKIKNIIQMITTFIVVVVGWIIFRAENMTQAIDYIIRIVFDFSLCKPSLGLSPLVYIFILMSVEWCNKNKDFGLDLNSNGLLKYRTIRWIIYLLLLVSVCFLYGEQVDFIYFQF